MWKKIKRSPIKTGLALIIAFRVTEGLTLPYALGFLKTVLGPAFAAICIAFVLNIPMVGIEKFFTEKLFAKLKSPKAVIYARTASLIIAAALVGALISVVLAFCIPDISKSIAAIAKMWPQLSYKFEKAIQKAPFLGNMLPGASLDSFIEDLAFSAGGLASSASQLAGMLFSAISDVVISLFLAVFLLFNKESISIQLKRAAFAFLDAVNAEFCVRASRLAFLRFRSFAISLGAGAAIEGVNFLLILTIFNFPYPLTISSLLALLALVPVLGAVIGFCATTALVAIAQPSMAGWFILVYILINQFDQQVVYPRIIGKAVGLDGFWVLLAVSVGAPLAGVTGIIFSVPITSILYTIATEYVEYYIGEKKIPPDKYL